MIVASDGSTDRTVELARAAGADVVLELPRGGKVAALNAGGRGVQGEVLAFSDANSYWAPDALRAPRRAASPTSASATSCGQVRFDGRAAAQPGGPLLALRDGGPRHGSRASAGSPPGNGAINAVRRDAYIVLEPDPRPGHLVPLRADQARLARRCTSRRRSREERIAATVDDEFGRKRRMMAGAWSTMLRHGLLSPARVRTAVRVRDRLASPAALRVAVPSSGRPRDQHRARWARAPSTWSRSRLQVALLAAAAIGRFVPLRPFRIAHYYVTVTVSSAAGLWEYLRHGVPITWDKAEGTR